MRSHHASGPVDGREDLRVSRDTSSGRVGSRLEKAARSFETMVVEGMVREMWKTIPVSKREEQSAGRSLANDLYQKELSKDLVNSGGFGLARQIIEDTRMKDGAVPVLSLPHDHPAALSVIV